MTGLVPVMWAVWGVLVLTTLGLKIYADRLCRDEDDQLVLDPAFDHIKDEQAAICAKVQKIEPLRKVMMWLAVAMTVVVIGYYAMDVLNQFK
jgi:hypothetical protein